MEDPLSGQCKAAPEGDFFAAKETQPGERRRVAKAEQRAKISCGSERKSDLDQNSLKIGKDQKPKARIERHKHEKKLNKRIKND
jgi:hypothetical protein